MGLLSPELYVDSSMVKANVNSYGLSRSGMTVEEFKEQATLANGLFVLSNTTIDGDGVGHEEVRYFQDPQGRLPLSQVDTDARWRTTRPGKPSGLNYQENVIADRGGFILARGITHASIGEWKAVPQLLERLPLQPVSLTGDTGYNAGELRQLLEHRNITAYIPIHPLQESNMVSTGGFDYRGHHLVCPQGKILNRGRFHNRGGVYQYVARQKDCQACPVKADCLPPGQKRRYIGLTMYDRPSAPESQGTEPDRRVSPGAEGTPYRRGGGLSISGQTGLGQVPAARIVESGLRGIYGRSGPQRAQGRATVAPKHQTSGSIETQCTGRRLPGNPKCLWRPDHHRRASTLQV